MSVSRFNDDLRPLAPGDRVSQAVTAARFNGMAKLAQEAAMGSHIRGGPGIRVRSGPHGTTITRTREFGRRGATTIHPFYIFGSGLVHAGTVSGEIPTLAGDPIGEDGNEITLTGSFYAYIKAVYTLAFGSHFFLNSAVPAEEDPLTIVTSETPLSDAVNLTLLTLTTYRLIAQVIGGVVMRSQPTTTNMNLSVCDASDGTEGGRGAQGIWTSAGA